MEIIHLVAFFFLLNSKMKRFETEKQHKTDAYIVGKI